MKEAVLLSPLPPLLLLCISFFSIFKARRLPAGQGPLKNACKGWEKERKIHMWEYNRSDRYAGHILKS